MVGQSTLQIASHTIMIIWWSSCPQVNITDPNLHLRNCYFQQNVFSSLVRRYESSDVGTSILSQFLFLLKKKNQQNNRPKFCLLVECLCILLTNKRSWEETGQQLLSMVGTSSPLSMVFHCPFHIPNLQNQGFHTSCHRCA